MNCNNFCYLFVYTSTFMISYLSDNLLHAGVLNMGLHKQGGTLIF
jgi:hypothetical protein